MRIGIYNNTGFVYEGLGTADILSILTPHFYLDHFQGLGSALLRRKRIVIRYFARGTNETNEREVSPLRLVYYRDNWYLDAWCHLRNDLRAFAVDVMQSVELLDAQAKDVDEGHLNKELGAGYGIFQEVTCDGQP